MSESNPVMVKGEMVMLAEGIYWHTKPFYNAIRFDCIATFIGVGQYKPHEVSIWCYDETSILRLFQIWNQSKVWEYKLR